MANPYVTWRRQPKLLIALAVLTVLAAHKLITADYIDGFMMLALVAMFVLAMADLPQRSAIAARAVDVLLLYVLGSFVWQILH